MIIKLENYMSLKEALFGTIWNNSYNQAHVVLSQLVDLSSILPGRGFTLSTNNFFQVS